MTAITIFYESGKHAKKKKNDVDVAQQKCKQTLDRNGKISFFSLKWLRDLEMKSIQKAQTVHA